MADQLIPDIAPVLDANGDPVSGGTVTFYQTGTTTLVTIYSDSAGTSPLSNPVTLDAAGRPSSQIFYTGSTGVKAVIKNSLGVTVRTVGPIPRVSISDAAASGITFNPIVNNAATNVQQAIENNRTTLNNLVDGTTPFTAIDVNGGAIDGTVIGANSAAGGTFSTVTINGGTATLATVDINGGAIDGTVIGANSAAAGTFGALTATGAVAFDTTLTVGSTFKVNSDSNTPGVGNTEDGCAIGSDGTGHFSKTAGVAGYFNRSNDGVIVSFRRAGVEIGSVDHTSGTTTYATSSDRRLKEDIADLTGAGERIDRLKPRTFVWRHSGAGRARGFIADEFQKVYPRSVTGHPGGPEMQAIDAGTPEVIADLVAEIQSLRKRLAALEYKA